MVQKRLLIFLGCEFLFPEVHRMQIHIRKLTVIWIYYCLREIMQITESKEYYLLLMIVLVYMLAYI